MITKKTQRRYPDRKWDYKAISTVINDNGTKREVYYYKLISNGKKSQGVEVYSGENYIVNSKDKSNSRRYDITEVPSKYRDVVDALKSIHNKAKWSSAKYVNEN